MERASNVSSIFRAPESELNQPGGANDSAVARPVVDVPGARLETRSTQASKQTQTQTQTPLSAEPAPPARVKITIRLHRPPSTIHPPPSTLHHSPGRLELSTSRVHVVSLGLYSYHLSFLSNPPAFSPGPSSLPTHPPSLATFTTRLLTTDHHVHVTTIDPSTHISLTIDNSLDALIRDHAGPASAPRPHHLERGRHLDISSLWQ